MSLSTVNVKVYVASYIIHVYVSSRLQEQIGLDSLSDSLILKVFSYLDPVMLCRCAQVSWPRDKKLCQYVL